MKCPDTGTMQAYIDGELDIGMKKDVEAHIRECGDCRRIAGKFKENDDFAFGKLKYYRDCTDKSCNQQTPPFRNKSEDAVNPAYEPASGNRKGVFEYMKKYRKYAAAVCIALAAVVCITVQPVRAAISDALSIFRVQSLKSISITPQELAQIRQSLSKGQGDITLDKLGRIKMAGGQMQQASLQEARQACGFPVITAQGLQDAVTDIRLIEPSTISFTLDTDSVNGILKSYNAPELLPDEINGKTFMASFGAQISINYKTGGKTYTVIETTSPDIQVPEGVDVDELFNTIVNVPVFPDELKAKLKSISDWKSTLYIPLLQDKNASITEVGLNGTKAYVASSTAANESGVSETNAAIIWMKNGTVYGVTSNDGKDGLVAFAKTLK